MDFFETGELCKGRLVAQRHVDHTVMDQSRQSIGNSRLLASSGGSCRHKYSRKLAVQRSLGP